MNIANTTMTQAFETLPLHDNLLKNIATLGYTAMTPIQAQSLPILLEGKDVIAKAKTGSGKTVAFGLTVLNSLKVENYCVQALILCPTRELAEQVSQALRQLARLMPNVKILNLSGGSPMKPQLDSLRHGAHIIVGTPGRVLKHLDKETLTLKHVHTLVLDEADKMLDMGFVDSITDVVAVCPKKRQTLLFSATYPPEIKKISRKFMLNPKEVMVETLPEDEHTIEQCFYAVATQAKKFALLKSLLLHYKPASTIIFCNMKQQTTDLAKMLDENKFNALALNGNMEQHERDQVLVRFANQSCPILVATDVAARGLDIKELPMVINYDLAHDADIHVHRIGRTGRAGAKGLAVSLTLPTDGERLMLIKENLQQELVWGKTTNLTPGDVTLFHPSMITVCLDAGRKDKIRPGDILGALTKDAGLPADAIGKIDIAAICSYVAIHKSQIDKAYAYLKNGKLKGRKVGVKKLL